MNKTMTKKEKGNKYVWYHKPSLNNNAQKLVFMTANKSKSVWPV